MAKLTEKQKRFIDYYIETGNQTEAARKAGYKQPQVQGAQNLEKLRNEISKRIESKDNERIASQDEVLEYLTSVLRGERYEYEVEYQREEETITEAKFLIPFFKERNQAAEMLAKRYGMFDPKTNVQIDKTKAEIEFIKERTKLLKGEKKDTSLLESLINVVNEDE